MLDALVNRIAFSISQNSPEIKSLPLRLCNGLSPDARCAPDPTMGLRFASSRRAVLLAQGGTCVGVFEKTSGQRLRFWDCPGNGFSRKAPKKGENFPENEKDGLQEKLTDHLMARPRGFEPPTYRFVAGHSIR